MTGASGTLAVICVPRDGRDSTDIFPPSSRSLSLMLTSPRPLLIPGDSASNPTPVSDTRSTISSSVPTNSTFASDVPNQGEYSGLQQRQLQPIIFPNRGGTSAPAQRRTTPAQPNSKNSGTIKRR